MFDKEEVKVQANLGSAAEKTKESSVKTELAPKIQTAQVKAVSEPQVQAESTPEIQNQTVAEASKDSGYRSEINGVEIDFELQYRDRETDMKDIAKRVTEDYVKRGNDASKIGLIQVYLKPTDYTAYYVINNSYEGKIPLFE